MLEAQGFTQVRTLLNSGNAVFTSEGFAKTIAKKIEAALIESFQFDSELIKVLVLSEDDIKTVISEAPQGFGSQPETYYSDVVFLIDVSVQEAFAETECHPEIDAAWQGSQVIYYQRLGSMRAKSRLAKIIGKPVYKSMTIRTWGTVKKLLERM